MYSCAQKAQWTVHQWKLSVHEISIWAVAWQNQQINMCAQQRLRSSWASAQSDHSLRCLHDETLTRSSTTHWAHSEDSCQTRRMPFWVFTGCICHFVGFVMLWLMYIFLFSWSKKKSRHLLAPSATFKEYPLNTLAYYQVCNNGFAG